MLKCLGGAVSVVIFVAWCSVASSEKEVSIPVSDAGEGTRCDGKDGEAAQICFQCTRLSPLIAVQLTDCCTEDKAYAVCHRCVTNRGACEAEILSLPNSGEEYLPSQEEYDMYPDENNDVYKRFGTTFMGSSRFGYPGKRYGTLFFGGKRDSGYRGIPYGWKTKRYGMLHIGGQRMGHYGYEKKAYDTEDQDVAKRYGRLFMSRNRYSNGNKRYGSLFMGNSKSKIWK